MSTNNYLFLIRGADWDKGLSPEEIQRVMSQTMRWFESLHQQGRVKGGQPLGAEGKTVSGKKATISDGPFVESKETIGGYLILQAASLEEATEIARGFPNLAHGCSIEVRPLAEECATYQRAKEQLALATA
ncbi:MAG TPA: YciI family protein [Verrucomicrobiae bacterium]